MVNPYRFVTRRASPARQVLDLRRTGEAAGELKVAPRPAPPIRQLPPPRVLIPGVGRR